MMIHIGQDSYPYLVLVRTITVENLGLIMYMGGDKSQ